MVRKIKLRSLGAPSTDPAVLAWKERLRAILDARPADHQRPTADIIRARTQASSVWLYRTHLNERNYQ